jgi:hypothetical protein
LPFVIAAVRPQQAFVAPILHGGSRDAEPRGDLLDRQQSEGAHPLETVPQTIVPADIDDCHVGQGMSRP